MPVSLSGATPAAAESKVGGRVSPRRAWLVVGCAAVVGALGTILLFGASATQPPSVSVSDEEAEVAAATEPVASDATQTMAAPTTDIESLPSAAVSVVSTPPARPKSISKVSAPARASTAAASVAAPAKAKATLVDPFE
jgi:cytoskeletal protein RodZ